MKFHSFVYMQVIKDQKVVIEERDSTKTEINTDHSHGIMKLLPLKYLFSVTVMEDKKSGVTIFEEYF